MALLVVGPLDLALGLTRALIVPPGNTAGSLTIQDAPDAATVEVCFNTKAPIPCRAGDMFDRLTPTDGSGGIYVNVAAQAGTLLVVVGLGE